MPATSTEFFVGDRVMERSHNGRPIVAKPGSTSFDQVCSYMREIRTGEVTALEERRIKNGSKIVYVQVRWDGYKSTSWHARYRLLHAQSPTRGTANTVKKAEDGN